MEAQDLGFRPDASWSEVQTIQGTHLSYNFYIIFYIGTFQDDEDIEGAREKFQWVVDVLLSTETTRASFYRRSLCPGYYALLLGRTIQLVDEILDMKIKAARTVYLKPLKTLQGKVLVEEVTSVFSISTYELRTGTDR